MVSNRIKNQHLSWRAGFGPMAGELQMLAQTSPLLYAEALFKASARPPQYIDVASNAVKGLLMGVDEIVKQNNQLSSEEKKKFREQSRQDIKSLNLAWLNEMVNSEQQLREKMSLFWHGHFASRNLNILYQQQLLDVIRQNALGNFGDLLAGVSKSAAIINFLNNNQNRKGHPNENFAREVMELFTLGRGNYTEEDVREAARAFTGWGANISGEFVFRKQHHDFEQKSFLQKTGRFTGDDILNILLQQKQTAHLITRKIYKYFVNEIVDPEKVNWLSEKLYQENYNILSLMKTIFTSDWFYEEKNIGSKIKSPIELIVGIQRILPMKFDNDGVQLLLQRLLGQLLFYPPNVAGWPGGKNWIDSSSLMLRLKIPQMIYSSGEVDMKPKDDDDQAMGSMAGRMNNKGYEKTRTNGNANLVMSSVDWNLYLQRFRKVEREKLFSEISSLLLQTPGRVNEHLIKQFVDHSSRETFTKTATIHLMSTPEYQLC